MIRAYDTGGIGGNADRKLLKFDAFNKPTRIQNSGLDQNLEDNGHVLEFSYGSNGQRFYQLKGDAPGQGSGYVGDEYKIYIDKMMEITGDINDTQDSGAKLYIGDYAVYDISTDLALARSQAKLQYLYRDRLGSVVAIADSNGDLVETAGRGFDPFGKPREDDWSDSDHRNNGLNDLGDTANLPGDLNRDDLTTRGFTGHEHLNETDLIHMNGRVYDYNLGRFYSVDPFIQFPENSQSVNGYSYILNNPLSGTDPSGYQSNSDVDTQTAAGSSSGGNSAMDTAKARIHKTAPTGSNIKSQVRIAVNGGTAEFSSSGELLSGSGNLRGLLSTLIVSGNGGVSAPTINMGNGQGNTGQDSPDGLSDVGKPGTGGNGIGNSLKAQMDATGCQVPYKCDSNLIDTKLGIKANSVTTDTLPSGSQGAGVSVPHWAKNPLGFAMFALTYSQGVSISADRADEYNRQIFRVVNPAEYAILQTTGQFPPSPSGFEEKQFWVRIEHAHKWVERLHMRGWESSVAIISTLVRDSTFRLSVDVNEPGIGYFRSFGPEALPILNRDAQEFGIYTHEIIGDGFE